jgi:hypothetical protein
MYILEQSKNIGGIIMAKYNVTFSCGHTETKELFGKHTDRERKIKWFEEEGLCSECYKKHMQEEREKMPLILNIGLDVYAHSDTPFELSFGGNSYSVKDDIKALGFRWGEIEGGFASIMDLKPNCAWIKRVSFDDLNAEIEKIKNCFPEIEIKKVFTDVDIGAYKYAVEKKNARESACKEELETVQRPITPECYPKGKWNGKFYGSSTKGYCIYIDGEKTPVSNQEKEEIEKYQSEMELYRNKAKKIKQKYNM